MFVFIKWTDSFSRISSRSGRVDLKNYWGNRSNRDNCSLTPDSEIFTETVEFDFEKLNKRVQELAFLNRGLRISITDKREGLEQTKYHYEGGIASYVQYINENKDVIFENPIYTDGEMDDITVEVAIQYNRLSRNSHEFANNIHTHEGGTHEQGFRTALTRCHQ